MERGFFHPSRGYWQTICEPSDEITAGYPGGTVEVSLKPSPLHEWVAGEWVEQPPPPPPVPATVSRFQARAVLLAENLLHRVESLISQSDDLTKLAWSETVEFHRTSPTIQKIAEYLELTPEQIDELFRKAANIRA